MKIVSLVQLEGGTPKGAQSVRRLEAESEPTGWEWT